MIQKIEIKNFKSILDEEIEFKKLNLLCGENASGKTSIIHALLIAIQKLNNKQGFDGQIVKIGNLSELRSFDGGSEIVIKITTDDQKYRILSLTKQDTGDCVLQIEESEQQISYEFEKDIYYLSSNRSFGFDTYSKDNMLFGVNGASSISFLSENQEEMLPDIYMTKYKECRYDSLVKENPTFLAHVRDWFTFITGEDLKIEPISHTNQFVLTYGGSDKSIRPINTGSGFSFILPLVIICLGAILRGGYPLIIIENPEIYLHPDAQEKLSFFIKYISNFTQVIMETHSEYILKHLMNNGDEDVQIILFKKKDKNSHIETLTKNQFVLRPVSYSEIMYKIFNVLSTDLHIALFSCLHEKYNKKMNKDSSFISDFDQYLATTFTDVPQKQRKHNSTTYNTLCSFIRNTIDHPEQTDASGNKYSYSDEELKKSIDYMFSIFDKI